MPHAAVSPAPAAPMSDEQVSAVYYLIQNVMVEPTYSEFFDELVVATGRPAAEVAAIIGASAEELAEEGITLSDD